MGKINAVVLAGDDPGDETGLGVKNKALLDICGRPMVEYVVDALRNSGCVDKISIVGPVRLLKNCLGNKVNYYFNGTGSHLDNLIVALEPFRNDRRVLLATSDVPMIDGRIVREFIYHCLDKKGDLCYPVVDKRLNEKKFPGVKRTYVKLKEGEFTGGNLIYFNPEIVERCKFFARKVIEYRKNPLKLCRLLGLRFLIMLLSGMLSISMVERRFSEILNIDAVAVILPYPEIVNDVDKPADVEIVSNYMCRRKLC